MAERGPFTGDVAPAVVRWEQVVADLFARTQRFPKSLRHSLTERVERRALDALEALVAARFAPAGPQTTLALAEADTALNSLQVLLRLAHRLGALSDGGYEALSTARHEVGRMVGGWRAASQR